MVGALLPKVFSIAMLSATDVAPPQLDEFMLPSEAHLRSAEMRALGWDEARVYAGV